MMEHYRPGEVHNNLVSLGWRRYEDMRMPWVGRYPGQRTLAVTDTSARVVDRNNNRVWMSIQNAGTNRVHLNFAEGAVADTSSFLDAGQAVTFDREHPWQDFITAICGAGLTSTLVINEVSQNTESGRGEE